MGLVAALTLTGVVSRFGYLAVGGIVFIESFGVPAPGETSIIAGATAAGHGELNIVAVGVVAFLAAVLGDSIGYLIGRTGGHKLVLRFGKYVFLTPERLERVEGFMAKRGAIMVIVARFVEGLRQFNGVVAGMTLMPFGRFLIFNAIGAALWVGVWSSAGYFAGSYFTEIIEAFHKYQWWALAGLALVIGLYVWWHVHKHRRKHRSGHREDVTAESDNPSPAR